MKLGVISDTHGLFDPKIPGIFKGVDFILHGGDIGPEAILHQLEEIAPVTAVLGNTDTPLPGIRETEFVECGELGVLIHHIVDPARLTESLSRRLELNKPRLVVFGHTHKPFSKSIGDVHFFNPGYAGPQRFELPRSVAILHYEDSKLREEYIAL
jgi:putative phosphoesterase